MALLVHKGWAAIPYGIRWKTALPFVGEEYVV